MKELEDIKLKAETINSSIFFYSNTANYCFDKIEDLRYCYTKECQEAKDDLYKKAKACIEKLEYEQVNLEKYGKDIDSCRNSVTASGFYI